MCHYACLKLKHHSVPNSSKNLVSIAASVAGAVIIAGSAAAQPIPTAAAPSLLSHSGDKLLVEGFVKDAEEMIEQAGAREPLDTAEVRTAIQKLKDALGIDPKNDSAYVDLGFAYALVKEPVLAVESYRRAVTINPSAGNFKELAGIYLRTGDAEQALMAANAGLQKDPNNAGLYNARGMALHDLTRFKEAARDFRRAIELDPKLAAARANLQAMGEGAPSSTITKPSRAAAGAAPKANPETAPSDEAQ